jgi:O-antigen/teichoic acid export membrane protein
MESDALEKVGRGSALIFVGFSLGTFFHYLYKMVLARFLGPESFGVFTQGLAISQAAATVALLGLNAAIPRFMSYYRGKGDEMDKKIVSTGLLLVTGTSLSLTGLIFFFSEWISLQIFHEAALITPLKIFSLAILPVVLLNFVVSMFRGRQKAKEKVVLEDMIWASLLPALTAAAILLGYGLNYAVLSYLISAVLTLFCGYYLYKRESNHGLTSDLITKKLLIFSWPLFLISVFAILNRWFDVLMLGWLGSSSTAGIYEISFAIAGYIGFLLEVLGFMFMPVISELHGEGNLERIKEVYTTATRWIISLSLPFLAGALIFTEEVINLLFGADYISGSTALTVLAIGFFYKVAKGPSEAILISIGETKKYLIGAGITTLLIASLNLLLIPEYGMLGAAFSTLAAFLIGDSILLLLTWREIGILPYNLSFTRVIPPILLSAGAVHVIHVILSPGLVGSMFLGGTMGLIYLALLYLFGGIQKKDLSLVQEILQRQ